MCGLCNNKSTERQLEEVESHKVQAAGPRSPTSGSANNTLEMYQLIKNTYRCFFRNTKFRESHTVILQSLRATECVLLNRKRTYVQTRRPGEKNTEEIIGANQERLLT